MAQRSDDFIPADWARYRGWLRGLAEAGVRADLRSRIDPSDLVQQSLMQAWNSLPRFRGSTEIEKMAWLRRILVNTIARSIRDHTREKRDIGREVTIRSAIESSCVRVELLARDYADSPPAAAIRAEQIFQLCNAVNELPTAQREAVQLHHWCGLSVSEISDRTGRSHTAVAGLLKRGLRTLREQLRSADPETGHTASDPDDGR